MPHQARRNALIGGTGPILVFSHLTDIEAVTSLSPCEGEMLMIDPNRDNRIPGALLQC